MSCLHLMVGLPGSGKTTRARELEQSLPALRFTPDDWQIPLFGNDFRDPQHDARHDTVEALMWQTARQALRLGNQVILDYGFWSRAERDLYRAEAVRLGAACQLHYTQMPLDELRRRLRARQQADPAGTYAAGPDDLKKWAALFEPPTSDELNRG